VLDQAKGERHRLGAEMMSLAAQVAAAPWEGLSSVVLLLAEAADGLADVEGSAERFAQLDSAWSAWKAGVADSDAAGPAPAAPAPGDGGAPVPAAGSCDEDLEVLRTDPELTAMFIAEAIDHLGTIEATVLQLESSPDDQKLLNDVFRPFHTIKGNAGALGVKSVQEFAHKVENLLDLGRSGKIRIGASETEAILESVDLLTTMINDLPSRLSGQPAVDVSERRRLLVAVIESLANPAAKPASPPAAGFDLDGPPAPPADVPIVGASAAPTRPAEVPAPGGRRGEEPAGASVKVDTRKLDNMVDMVGELVIVQSIISADPALLRVADERLSRNLAQFRRITSDLQRNAMSMRMVPIRQTFQKMARLVRDLSKKAGKPVDLVLSGEDTELDRKVVEDINDPLMHMVRNSVDHGIEPSDVRTAHGKPAVGRLALEAFHQGGNIVIAIEDDGRGLDAEKILAKAVAQDLVRPGEPLSPQEIHQLIFRPGFSTADRVTEISGRGVGMDVVRRNIEALRGRVEIQTVLGQGTRFLIKLPLTLAIVEGLLLRVGAQRFVLPTFAVRESLRPRPEQIHLMQGSPRMISVRDTLMPMVRLGDLFDVEGAVSDPAEATAVVIEGQGRPVALLVDQLLGKQEVVIKSLGEAFAHVRGIAGGAILGDGRVGLILDAGGLAALMGRHGLEAA
jgi:two-component system chemotaxis sensor kinase CheA